MNDRHHHRAQKSLLHGERTQREEKERNASSPPRVIYTTRVKEEQRENKSQRFQGKFVFCATQREKRNTRILKLLRSTRLIKRTLAFGTFVETNDDSFSSSFSSRIFVSLAIFIYVFSTLTNLKAKRRKERRVEDLLKP